ILTILGCGRIQQLIDSMGQTKRRALDVLDALEVALSDGPTQQPRSNSDNRQRVTQVVRQTNEQCVPTLESLPALEGNPFEILIASAELGEPGSVATRADLG